METGLVIITVLATMAAIGASVFAWRTLAEQKRRDQARVAALTAAAGVTRVEPRAAAAAPDVLRAETPSVAEPGAYRDFLGSASTGPASGLQRALAGAALVFALGLAAFGVVRMAGGGATAVAAPAAPLELLSLRHEREGPRLSVAGLVRNPEAGVAVDRLNAVVLLFDEHGTFITSARAPVEFARLAAGDESPFVISMDAPLSVARYRVSFRSHDSAMPHVDRRGDPAAAAPAVQAR